MTTDNVKASNSFSRAQVALYLALVLVIPVAAMVLFKVGPHWWVLVQSRVYSHRLNSAAGPFANSVAANAASALAELGEAGIPSLIGALKSPQLSARRAAASHLVGAGGSRQEREAVDALKAVVAQDQDRGVRLRAAWTLYRLGRGRDVLPCLTETLGIKPGEPDYRFKIKLAVECRAREAVDAILLDFRAHDHPDSVRALCLLLGKDTPNLPAFQCWAGLVDQIGTPEMPRGTESRILTPGKKAEVVSELEAWWRKHQDEFPNISNLFGTEGANNGR